MGPTRSGYTGRVIRDEWRTRNWAALTALWTLGIVWLALAALAFLAGVFDVDPPEAVGWTLLVLAMVGFAFALLGVSAIRERGETAVAAAALALALVLPTAASLFAFGLFGSFE